MREWDIREMLFVAMGSSNWEYMPFTYVLNVKRLTLRNVYKNVMDINLGYVVAVQTPKHVLYIRRIDRHTFGCYMSRMIHFYKQRIHNGRIWSIHHLYFILDCATHILKYQRTSCYVLYLRGSNIHWYLLCSFSRWNENIQPCNLWLSLI